MSVIDRCECHVHLSISSSCQSFVKFRRLLADRTSSSFSLQKSRFAEQRCRNSRSMSGEIVLGHANEGIRCSGQTLRTRTTLQSQSLLRSTTFIDPTISRRRVEEVISTTCRLFCLSLLGMIDLQYFCAIECGRNTTCFLFVSCQ